MLDFQDCWVCSRQAIVTAVIHINNNNNNNNNNNIFILLLLLIITSPKCKQPPGSYILMLHCNTPGAAQSKHDLHVYFTVLDASHSD